MRVEITIYGKGGHGVKKLADIICAAALLQYPDLNVAIGGIYDSAVRGGISNGFIILSDKEIVNPVLEEANVTIDLNDGKIAVREKFELQVSIPKMASRYRGIFLLGMLVRTNSVEVISSKTVVQALHEIFHSRSFDKNLEIFRKGFEYE